MVKCVGQKRLATEVEVIVCTEKDLNSCKVNGGLRVAKNGAKGPTNRTPSKNLAGTVTQCLCTHSFDNGFLSHDYTLSTSFLIRDIVVSWNTDTCSMVES